MVCRPAVKSADHAALQDGEEVLGGVAAVVIATAELAVAVSVLQFLAQAFGLVRGPPITSLSSTTTLLGSCLENVPKVALLRAVTAILVHLIRQSLAQPAGGAGKSPLQRRIRT
jgi:hypothetical protein